MDKKGYDEQQIPARGYRPLALTLTGFKGIKSGLGRDTVTLDVESLAGEATLVAIAGANGRGKTTVMDNLTPYLVMPSRAGADGLGAFSYYDHVFLPESQKELVWEHRGHRYKSQLVFRINGKRKTEAFLFERGVNGWKPVMLADGTVSDGKVDTYERAVSELLGPPETFFTSVFSAQGKRPLSAYRNGEIKTLLADLLGLDQVREQGERAAETARLLKNGLGVMRQEQTAIAVEIARLSGETAELIDAESAVAHAETVTSAAAQALEAARLAEAAVALEASAAAGIEQRRAELGAERDRANAVAKAALRRIDDEAGRLDSRTKLLSQRIAQRQRQHDEVRSRLIRQRESHRQHGAGRVARAAQEQDLAARPGGGGHRVQVRQVAAGAVAIQVHRLGAGEQRGALVDLVERVRHQHRRRGASRVHHGLHERKQALARAVDRQHHGFGVHRCGGQREPSLQPSGDGLAQLGQADGQRIAAERAQRPRQGVADERGRRVPGLADRQRNVRQRGRRLRSRQQRAQPFERVGPQQVEARVHRGALRRAPARRAGRAPRSASPAGGGARPRRAAGPCRR